jgi:1-acyl-sn-glycerol-3-phosphate acyltransferase
MTAVASLWAWFEIVLVVIAGFFVQLVLAVLAAPFDRGRLVAGRFFRWMGIAAAKLNPSWDFGVLGPARKPAARTVVVSNHASNADPFLISSLPWEMKWLSKASLFRIPFIGWSMWLAGDVPVKRGEKSSAEEAMRVCARWIERGVPVMIFPEGTRSKTPELLPFKDGAFRLAIETGADVLPIAVAGTSEALPKHSWRFGRARARVTVGEAISTKGMTLESVETLKVEARARIEALRERLRAA